MKRPVTVRFSNSALGEMLAIDRWWRLHHPANSSGFDDEMTDTMAFLERTPEGAPIAQSQKHKRARVKVMTQTGHLVVYWYAKKTKTVTITAVVAAKATSQRP